MKDFKIHILCLKREICTLIKKTLASEGYDLACTNVSGMPDEIIKGLKLKADCLILDNDIKPELRRYFNEKFKGVPIICLPSLNSDWLLSRDVTYISEPLKLSELRRAIDEIYKSKRIESHS
jgi:hypothetical protein